MTEITNLDSQKANTPRWPRKQPFAPNILVMKGGGVKGIAYVGALQTLEKYGYQFNHFVGTSAGAISAALLSVGYSSTELGEILKKTDFRTFKDGYLLTSLLLLPFRKGLYQGEQFRIWLDNCLRQKFPEYSDAVAIRFKHLNNIKNASRRLTVFTSTKGRTAYSFDSDDPVNGEDEISFACRCSMAIPYFFIPERIDGQWVVDGGMQNNYPINAILDKFPDLKDSSNFVGLYLGNKKTQRKSEWLLFDIFSIWSESSDEEAKEYFIDRTIVIDPRPVKTTDFSLSTNDVDFLLAEGKASALRWLFHWSEGKRPSKEEVESAELISAQLRENVVKERRRKLWQNFMFIICALIFLGLIGWFLFKYLRPPIEENSTEHKYKPCQFGSRIGSIIFQNNSNYPVNVKLWHPANTNQQFRQWEISSKTTKKLSENDDKGYGDDWGIQIGDSEIKCISMVNNKWDYNKGEFFISTDTFYSNR